MIRRTLRPAIWPASLVACRSASLKYAGTVMTASVTGSPRYDSASRLSFCRMNALICCGVKVLPSISCDQDVPMCRLTERIVRSTLVTAWRLATSPTSTSPFLANATTLGVVRLPSALAMTVGSPPSRTLTTELVVPRSMPTARAMSVDPSRELWCCGAGKSLGVPDRLSLSLLDSVSHASDVGQVGLSLTRSTNLLLFLFPSAADAVPAPLWRHRDKIAL